MKSFITILILFLFLLSHSQVTIVQVDSTHRRFCTTNADGSFVCGPSLQIDTMATYLYGLVSDKKKMVETAPWSKELADLDTLLKKYTGKDHATWTMTRIAALLPGDWMVLENTDTTFITIKEDLTIIGGKIKGKVMIIDDKHIDILGVLPERQRLPIAKLDNNKIKLKRVKK